MPGLTGPCAGAGKAEANENADRKHVRQCYERASHRGGEDMIANLMDP